MTNANFKSPCQNCCIVLFYCFIVVLCRYAKEKFGWDKKRCDQELLPVIRRINQRREVCMLNDVC